MYAIVSTGGKQYKVANNDVIEIEKLSAEVGDKVDFNVVTLVDGSKLTVDAAELAKIKVEGEVLEHFKGDKQIVFKFKKRKGYKRLRGHRQQLTRVRITSVAGTKAPAVKAAAKSEPAAKADSAAKKAPASKTAASKSTANKKTTTAKSTAKKSTGASKSAAKKTATAKKPAAKKPAAKKTSTSTKKDAASDEDK